MDDYLPARMINEFVYCPRLFYLMHVEGQFAQSHDTIDGQIVHARVDSGRGGLAAATGGGGLIPDADIDDAPVAPPAPPKKQKRKAKVQAATLFGTDESDADESDAEEERLQEPDSDSQGEQADEDEELDGAGNQTIHARSVMLSSDELGVIAKMDLIQANGDDVTPVDYKRGSPRRMQHGTLGAWGPERVQMALQALVLRDNGYRCDSAVLYFNTTRQRVTIAIDEPLLQLTRQSIVAARALQMWPQIPEPLVDSPKCARCSLVNICLPDETRAIAAATKTDQNGSSEPIAVRPMITTRDERRPLYFNQQGIHIGKKDEVIVVKLKGTVLQEVRLREINQLNLFGNIQLSTQALQTAMNLDIPIVYFTQRGYFYGITHPLGVKNIQTRRRQFAFADDSKFCLDIARALVRGKIRNCRTLLMRNHREPPAEVLRDLKRAADRALGADSLASLLGIEGTAARLYFGQLAGMLKVDCDLDIGPGALDTAKRPAFDFRGRNRRPPRDPVNALLSLAYSLLTKDCLIAATAVGLDPYLGFYHQIKPGKPALALDLMEPFRPLIADSVVLSAINNRMVTPSHFIVAGKSVVLSDAGRKHFLLAYEQRMDALVTHPLFGYRVSYRRLLEIQTRLLARRLTGEISDYPVFETR